MKTYFFILVLLIFSYSNAQENTMKLEEQKVKTENQFLGTVKLIYHFEYHLSFPRRTDRYRNLTKSNVLPFSFEREFGNRIQGNYSASPVPQTPGAKPLQYSPLIVIDGRKY